MDAGLAHILAEADKTLQWPAGSGYSMDPIRGSRCGGESEVKTETFDLQDLMNRYADRHKVTGLSAGAAGKLAENASESSAGTCVGSTSAAASFDVS